MKRFTSILILSILIFTSILSAKNIIIHYHRFNKDYDNWNLWLWAKGKEGRAYNISGKDKYGVYYKITLPQTEEAGFIVRKGDWQAKDIDADRYIDIQKQKEFWLIQGEKKIYHSPPSLKPKIIGAYVDAKNKINVLLSKKVNLKKLTKKTIKLYDHQNKKIPIKQIFGGHIIKPVNSIEIILKKRLNLSDNLTSYKIIINGFQEQNLMIRNVLSDKKYYSKKRMGFVYSKKATLFRIFAPTADNVFLQIYDKVEDSKPQQEYTLSKKEKGLWEIKIKKDLLGKYYTYKVKGTGNFSSDDKIVDIYSICNTGKYNKGMIINNKTPVKNSPKFDIKESIIYELHIRDFTIDKNSKTENRGKYLGMTEKETAFKNLKTGMDHLTDLGINVVQIMPIQDFDNNEEDFNTYNWGYMPNSYNSPDGWFASNIKDDSRIKEFKKVVDTLHKKGIKVILDVVYNHTSPNASFQKIAPDYYFRKKQDGSFWNGSGCGNEFQSEYPMARKYIIDSLKYWVKEYKVDGFRFDLMGLIDIKTMTKLTKELKKIKKDILIYGEPWSAGPTPTKQTLKGTQKGKGFSVFNDHFRDAVKGSVFGLDAGYIQGKTDQNIVEKVQQGIKGSIDDFAENPLETINYVACHDNHTLWDRINLSLKEHNDPAKNDIETKKSMQKLAGAIILLSQGIPFLHSGQEMCRTKKGDENSYNKDDSINQIYWIWKDEYNDVFQYYKGLISLRKAHSSFKMKETSQIRKYLKFQQAPNGCISYMLNYSKDKWDKIIVLINPFRNSKTFFLPDGPWNLVVDHKRAGNKTIKRGIRQEYSVAPVSLAVLYQ